MGWADLRASNAPDVLAVLARDHRLKGIRPMLQDEPDAAWILRPDVQPALAALPALGLRFDALAEPANLGALLQMREHHSGSRGVIDHCAKPDIAAGTWLPWADDLAAIARRTSAHCKLSGLVTEAGARWNVARLDTRASGRARRANRRAAGDARGASPSSRFPRSTWW